MIKEQKIKELNAYFKSLTKAEKKVAIAKDVLLQLKNEKYIAKKGSYVFFSSSVNYKDDIQSNFDKIEKCQVCALGSAALSCIKYTNNATFDDVSEVNDKFWNQLLKVFTKKELVVIEYAFEGFTYDGVGMSSEYEWGITLSDNIIKKTIAFFSKYDNSDKRLKAIMKNIIKNEGKFVL